MAGFEVTFNGRFWLTPEDLFWRQLDWIGPESYVADNDYLSFVSVNKSLFDKVHDAVKALGTH